MLHRLVWETFLQCPLTMAKPSTSHMGKKTLSPFRQARSPGDSSQEYLNGDRSVDRSDTV